MGFLRAAFFLRVEFLETRGSGTGGSSIIIPCSHQPGVFVSCFVWGLGCMKGCRDEVCVKIGGWGEERGLEWKAHDVFKI